MTKEQIGEMFRLAALNRHTPACDKGKDMLEMALAGAVEQYREEVLGPANKPEQKAEEDPVWIRALQYIENLFKAADADENEPGKAEMRKFRQAAFFLVAEAVSARYGNKSGENG